MFGNVYGTYLGGLYLPIIHDNQLRVDTTPSKGAKSQAHIPAWTFSGRRAAVLDTSCAHHTMDIGMHGLRRKLTVSSAIIGQNEQLTVGVHLAFNRRLIYRPTGGLNPNGSVAKAMS
ncbi:hypothetical protein QCA50_013424 [Cerrena zonata]|uniref:Uncharacterized protein n=1 Tax=Cerrena zonata TaxID=2478898 RepID=A0AAW0FS22_9APHY